MKEKHYIDVAPLSATFKNVAPSFTFFTNHSRLEFIIGDLIKELESAFLSSSMDWYVYYRLQKMFFSHYTCSSDTQLWSNKTKIFTAMIQYI